MIARCAGATDVVHAVRFARQNNLLAAVRGGGHNVAGNAVCDGGLVIDLSQMKGIRVDPHQRTADAQPGLTLGEFDSETQAFGLATTLGAVSVTGIAGLTLGGGLGWLMGKYGLACDNVLSLDIVTADGELRTASPTENEELFWCVRGGGGKLRGRDFISLSLAPRWSTFRRHGHSPVRQGERGVPVLPGVH